MLVVHDELDLPPGAVKLKFGGGTGGHNGLRDIDEVLGTRDFWRLRIGIGHPGHKDVVADYVLHEARREEREAIEPAFDRSLGLLAAHRHRPPHRRHHLAAHDSEARGRDRRRSRETRPKKDKQ